MTKLLIDIKKKNEKVRRFIMLHSTYEVKQFCKLGNSKLVKEYTELMKSDEVCVWLEELTELENQQKQSKNYGRQIK